MFNWSSMLVELHGYRYEAGWYGGNPRIEVTRAARLGLGGGTVMDNAYASLPELKIPEDEAKQEIQSQIEKGQEIRDLDIKSEDDLAKVRREFSKWSNFNIVLLKKIFSDESVAERYSCVIMGWKIHPMYATSLDWRVQELRKPIADYIARLEGIVGEIAGGLYSISAETEGSLGAGYVNIEESKIFIVHGTDPTNPKDRLKNLLTEWRIDAIILNEQPSRGRTIIEKFEEHSDEVGCAIVLLTPDDEGRAKGTDDWVSRARQNVVFELGFFIGRLGRDKTICLYKGDIELPSDIHGIVYIRFDRDVKDASYELRKELKDIGFPING